MYDKKKAVSFMIMATVFFALMSFFVKLASGVPSIEKAMYRNFLGIFMMLVPLTKKAMNVNEVNGTKVGLKIFKPKAPLMLLLRSIFGTLGIITTFYAIDNLTLADSTILTRMSPFFTVLGASLFLGEKLTKKVVLAMFTSFLGVLLVVKPSFDVELLPYVAGVSSAFFAGMAYMFVRILGTKGEDSDVIVFYFSVFSTLAIMPLAFRVYENMTPIETVYVVASSVMAILAQVCITRAYKFAPANEVSVYLNMQVIFTAILGIIFFNEIPDYISVLGYVVIIGASYWAFNSDSSKKVKKSDTLINSVDGEK